MSFVTGMLAAVPVASKQAFIDHARAAADVFREYGAVEVVECWGVDIPDGKRTSMPMAVEKREDETVVLSWIVWPSKEVADTGMSRMMEDPRMTPETNPMPFDGSRMIFGGFDMVLKA